MIGREYKVKEDACLPFVIHQLPPTRLLVPCSFWSNIPRKTSNLCLLEINLAYVLLYPPFSDEPWFTPNLTDPNPSKTCTLLFLLWILPWQGLQPVSLPNFYLGSQPDFHPGTRNHLHSGGRSAAQDDFLQRLWGRKEDEKLWRYWALSIPEKDGSDFRDRL